MLVITRINLEFLFMGLYGFMMFWLFTNRSLLLETDPSITSWAFGVLGAHPIAFGSHAINLSAVYPLGMTNIDMEKWTI